jgi:hypothetical protein
MDKMLVTLSALSWLLVFAACNAANQGATGTGSPAGQPEPGSPAAQMQQK